MNTTPPQISEEAVALVPAALSRRGFIAGTSAGVVSLAAPAGGLMLGFFAPLGTVKIGRASCRERV